MAQTDKAKQNQAGQQNQESETQSLTAAELTKLLAPMQETIAQLKADNEQKVVDKAAREEAARQTQVNKDADIATMLGEANVEASGDGNDPYEKLSKRQMVEIIAGAVETAMPSMESCVVRLDGSHLHSIS